MKNFEEEFMLSRPYECKVCDGKKMIYIGGGSYQCKDCGHIALDDFGKVKAFLDEHGTQPMLVVSEATGVSIDILKELLKNGRLQLPINSKAFLKCEKCGCALRYGRYCPDCAMETFQGIRGAFLDDFGERLKHQELYEVKNEVAGKIRFMGSNRKR